MSSSNKTSLGLNLWAGTDKPKREDFNSDNEITDQKILEILANLENKANKGISGIFTPSIEGFTTSVTSATYYKLGNLVYLFLRFDLTAFDNTNPSGRFEILGLPFVPSPNYQGLNVFFGMPSLTRVGAILYNSTIALSINGTYAARSLVPLGEYFMSGVYQTK